MRQGPMPFRDRGAYLPVTKQQVNDFAGRHPDYLEMNQLLVVYGFAHTDDIRNEEGQIAARRFQTVGQKRLLTLWKDGRFEAAINYQPDTATRGHGLDELQRYLRSTFGQGDAA